MRRVAHAVALALAAVQLFAVPAAAQGDLMLRAAESEPLSDSAVGYLCQLDVPYSQRWVPPILFIAHDPETGRVVVSDPIVLSFNAGLPVTGKVASETTSRIRFAWDYPVEAGGQQTRKMLYRAGIEKATGKVTVTALPAGFSTVFQADGRCESQPLEELAGEP